MRPRLEGLYFTCSALVETDGVEWPEIEFLMIEPYRADCLGYFEELARALREGRMGRSAWESEYSELRLVANLREQVIRFDLRAWWSRRDEEQSGELTVPADGVARFAERMRSFLRLDEGRRLRRTKEVSDTDGV